jgi:hypothetical protein
MHAVFHRWYKSPRVHRVEVGWQNYIFFNKLHIESQLKLIYEPSITNLVNQKKKKMEKDKDNERQDKLRHKEWPSPV